MNWRCWFRDNTKLRNEFSAQFLQLTQTVQYIAGLFESRYDFSVTTPTAHNGNYGCLVWQSKFTSLTSIRPSENENCSHEMTQLTMQRENSGDSVPDVKHYKAVHRRCFLKYRELNSVDVKGERQVLNDSLLIWRRSAYVAFKCGDKTKVTLLQLPTSFPPWRQR